MESKDGKNQIVLNYKGKTVYEQRNCWLVLIRTLLAGFNAPINNKNLRLAALNVKINQ